MRKLEMEIFVSFAATFVLCSLIGGATYYKKALDGPGSLLAFIIGMVIGVFGHIIWVGMLLLFMSASFIATRFKYEAKKARGVAEGKEGTRGAINVAANGLVPTLICVIGYFFGRLGYIDLKCTGLVFVTAISSAASDTLASEIGVFSDRVVLITNPMMRVKAGTDGGISVLGELAAFGAAVFVSVVYWVLSYPFGLIPGEWYMLFLPIIFGFLGCQIDSVLGATLERRKIIGKHGVNFLSILLASLLVFLVVIFI
ncbi:MAG: DUF92 domain-containing protein [Thermoplasmata archaeon]